MIVTLNPKSPKLRDGCRNRRTGLLLRAERRIYGGGQRGIFGFRGLTLGFRAFRGLTSAVPGERSLLQKGFPRHCSATTAATSTTSTASTASTTTPP